MTYLGECLQLFAAKVAVAPDNDHRIFPRFAQMGNKPFEYPENIGTFTAPAWFEYGGDQFP